MTSPQQTPFGYEEYLASLPVADEGTVHLVYTMDGAGLYKVTDDHYVIIACTQCKHEGPALLERVLPRDPAWESFFVAANDDDGFSATHYGPA